MDLFLDFDYMLDCESKINYEALLNSYKIGDDFKYNVSKNSKKYLVAISKNIVNSTDSIYYYQVEIAPGIYKTIKIQ